MLGVITTRSSRTVNTEHWLLFNKLFFIVVPLLLFIAPPVTVTQAFFVITTSTNPDNRQQCCYCYVRVSTQFTVISNLIRNNKNLRVAPVPYWTVYYMWPHNEKFMADRLLKLPFVLHARHSMKLAFSSSASSFLPMKIILFSLTSSTSHSTSNGFPSNTMCTP